MKTILKLTFALLTALATQGAGGAETVTLWKPIAGLSGGPWTLVSILEGTLAVRHRTLPYEETSYGPIGPAAAFRPAGAATTTWQSIPLPSLGSSWGWRPELTGAVVADGKAFIASSTGIHQFNAANLNFVSTWWWGWDTSQDLTVIPNSTGITLQDGIPAPAFFFSLLVRSHGSKSGLRIVQPREGNYGLDAALTYSTTEPYKVLYQNTHLAWSGTTLCPGPAVPPILFTNYNSYTLDGQTTQQLPSGYSQTSKCTGSENLWLIEGPGGASHSFDGTQLKPLNFGRGAVMSQLSDGTLVLSNENGAFERTVEVLSGTYQELTGAARDPFAKDSSGIPAAITWATEGTPLRTETYKLTIEFRQQLASDLEYFLEGSPDLTSWYEMAHTVGSSASLWEGVACPSVVTLPSGRIAVERYFYGSAYYWRLGVRSRPQAP